MDEEGKKMAAQQRKGRWGKWNEWEVMERAKGGKGVARDHERTGHHEGTEDSGAQGHA